MKIYTQAEFNDIPRDNKGIKHCPNGDYSEIKFFGERCSFSERCSFGEYCSFGKRCSFSEWCSFGERCSFGYRCFFENVGVAKAGYPFAAYIGAGSRQGSKTYFFNLEAGIYVRCGCFLGTLDEFIAKVEETHGDSHAGQEYKAIAELIRDKFS